MRSLLVSAGEASGDRAAAEVVKALDDIDHRHGTRTFGLGGPALHAAGMALVADARGTAALGITAVAARAPTLVRAFARLLLEARKKKPDAALLVNYTEFNLRLGRALRAMGVPVVWYGAPQTWAWRQGRLAALTKAQDKLAVFYPFEVPHFARAGIDVTYVGHPALEIVAPARASLKQAFDLPARAPAVAICPGSRASEVRALLTRFLDAYLKVKRRIAAVDARVLVSQGLDRATRRWVTATSRARGVPVLDVPSGEGAARWLFAFDAALVASGTASLEAALAGATPIIAYRVSLAAEFLLRRCLTVSHVGLPNLVLGESAFPELLQSEASVVRIASTLTSVLRNHERYLAHCHAVRRRFGEATPSRSVAKMLLDVAGP